MISSIFISCDENDNYHSTVEHRSHPRKQNQLKASIANFEKGNIEQPKLPLTILQENIYYYIYTTSVGTQPRL